VPCSRRLRPTRGPRHRIAGRGEHFSSGGEIRGFLDDALRVVHPDERIYTFWKYFRNAFARNAGLRIDHLLLSPSLAGRLVAAGVDRDVRARERSSDHAPVWIELGDANTG
jgi:exonuclease III